MRVALRRAFSILLFLNLNLFGQQISAYISKWTQDGDIGTVTVGRAGDPDASSHGLSLLWSAE